LQIDRDPRLGTIKVHQQKYAEEVLAKFEMADCKPMAVPLDPKCKLSLSMGPESDEDKAKMAGVPYREAVGSLMYLMVCTRPDLAAAVSVVSRFMQNPGVEHWQAVRQILRYVRGTTRVGLEFHKGSEVIVSGYVDADWGGCVDTRKSTSGYIFLCAGAAISWASKKQPTVALSSTEAEYIAACFAAKEASWLDLLFGELGYPQEVFRIESDNQSSLALMSNPVYHDRTKHVDIQYHFVREKVEDGLLEFVYCPTTQMAADSLTKGVPKVKFEQCRRQFGLA
jgi:hypothetical protein